MRKPEATHVFFTASEPEVFLCERHCDVRRTRSIGKKEPFSVRGFWGNSTADTCHDCEAERNA